MCNQYYCLIWNVNNKAKEKLMEKVKGKPVISERERLKKDRDDWEQAK